MAASQRQQQTLIWPLIRLTALLFGLQLLIVYFNFGRLLASTVVNHFIADQVLQSPLVLSGIAAGILVQLLIYTGFVLLIWGITRLIGRLFHLHQSTLITYGLLLWADAVITLYLANHLLYPNSQFSLLLNTALHTITAQPAGPIFLFLLYVFGGIFMVAALAALTCILMLSLRHVQVTCAVLLLGGIAGGGYYYSQMKTAAHSAIAPKLAQPNIVLLSIDYFRPGDTTYFGHKTELTPYIDQFLTQATVFENSLSAIARTFPSLMSVESGTYPKKSGARHNLILPSLVNHDNTIGHILQAQNYYTMLATDGSHFFYMDPSYGFNQIVAPRPGLNEFLFSAINDFPLSNLLMNTAIGKPLFPYNYMNRNANITYSPMTFNKELQRALQHRPANKPLYIHIHLTLAAWPYMWDKTVPAFPPKATNTEKAQWLFNNGLRGVDLQFSQIQHILQQQHVLDNALLVVFSDHGQAFGEPGDRVTERSHYVGTAKKEDIRRFTNLASANGHGTDILSLKQSHPLLAFKLYGARHNQVGQRALTACLIDIAPTILDYLRLPQSSTQGISLLPDILSNPATGIGNRPIFMETELTLPSILTADPSINKVLSEGIGYYQLDKKTGMLEVKPLFTRIILKGKQRAVIQGKWMLAMYPNTNAAATLVLVNLANKQWTLDMTGAFAQASPLPQLLAELQQFYGDEVAVPTLAMPPAGTATEAITLNTAPASPPETKSSTTLKDDHITPPTMYATPVTLG